MWLTAGAPGDVCDVCQSTTDPILWLVPDNAVPPYRGICVLCVVKVIDRVTGWRMASNVRQALLVGNAGERFHHPERFVKVKKTTPREVLQNNRERRAANDAKVVQSDVPNRHVEMWE